MMRKMIKKYLFLLSEAPFCLGLSSSWNWLSRAPNSSSRVLGNEKVNFMQKKRMDTCLGYWAVRLPIGGQTVGALKERKDFFWGPLIGSHTGSSIAET